MPTWITTTPEIETPLFVRTFSAGRGMPASVRICGLGYFTLLVNGQRVSTELFTPAQTNYASRDLTDFAYHFEDHMATRAYYLTYDLTPFLKDGENRMEVILGNGWFRQKERVCEGYTVYFPSLVLTYTLQVGSTTYLSDGSEDCFVYPILESNLYLGEQIDLRLFEAPLAPAPTLIADFDVPLYPQSCAPDRVIRTISPRLMKREGSVAFFDAGENISGIVSLKARGKRGDEITLTFAEAMKDGTLDLHNLGGYIKCASGRMQEQRDHFILREGEQEIRPMFVFHGFRYFTVKADCEYHPTVEVIHTDVETTSTFSCDDAVLNWLYDAYLRSQLGNLHGAMPSDCPHRERLGYTGDGQACATAAMLCLDMKRVYPKWLDDILDSQDALTGHIKHTAPFMGGGGGPGGWCSAVALLPWQMYMRYGELAPVKTAYPAICRFVDYLLGKSEDLIIVKAEEGGWCLGDWCTPEPIAIPPAFVNTCYFARVLDIASTFATLLGHQADSARYAALARKVRERAHAHFFDGSSYCGGIQGADAYAVWASLPEAETLAQRLLDRYEKAPCLDTGFLGTDILCGVLFDLGMGDIALRLLSADHETVGFARMMREGATTIWEYLESDGKSQNHPMFGACVTHLFTGLLGIQNAPGKVGYKDLIISPCLSSHVKQASGSIATDSGDIAVSFRIGAQNTAVTVTLPEGVKALLRVGDQAIPLSAGTRTVLL